MHSYQDDVVAWATEQASLLRTKRFDLLDIDHLAEEIEDVGKSEQRELASRLAVLLAHLLKWDFQPERRCASWESTLREQRRAISRRLRKTPSLQNSLNDPDWWDDVWLDARIAASQETGIEFDRFPVICPWACSSVLDETSKITST